MNSSSPKKTGRPSMYSEELAVQFCEYMADGLSIRQVCAMEGMPSWAVIRKWLAENRDGFAVRYARAKQVALELMEADIIEIADKAVGVDDTAARRLQVDARKWTMSKLAPKKYGDKLDLNHSGEVAVESKGLSGLLSAVTGSGNASDEEGP